MVEGERTSDCSQSFRKVAGCVSDLIRYSGIASGVINEREGGEGAVSSLREQVASSKLRGRRWLSLDPEIVALN